MSRTVKTYPHRCRCVRGLMNSADAVLARALDSALRAHEIHYAVNQDLIDALTAHLSAQGVDMPALDAALTSGL